MSQTTKIKVIDLNVGDIFDWFDSTFVVLGASKEKHLSYNTFVLIYKNLQTGTVHERQYDGDTDARVFY